MAKDWNQKTAVDAVAQSEAAARHALRSLETILSNGRKWQELREELGQAAFWAIWDGQPKTLNDVRRSLDLLESGVHLTSVESVMRALDFLGLIKSDTVRKKLSFGLMLCTLKSHGIAVAFTV
jgi:hypothetical protein